MTLSRFQIDRPKTPFSEKAQAYLEQAELATAAIYDQKTPLPGFVPSDYLQAYEVLAALKQQRLLTGSRLCEWGSGLGVVAGLASFLGYEAYGIEIEHDLVHHAKALANQQKLNVELVQGSFVPEDAEDLLERYGQTNWLIAGEEPAYDLIDLEIEDFDVIYAYPWPNEHEVLDELFNRYAASGAVLVTYHGVEEMRFLRKN